MVRIPLIRGGVCSDDGDASSLDWTFYDSATREALDHVVFSKD
jgi:hypothetical protein